MSHYPGLFKRRIWNRAQNPTWVTLPESRIHHAVISWSHTALHLHFRGYPNERVSLTGVSSVFYRLGSIRTVGMLLWKEWVWTGGWGVGGGRKGRGCIWNVGWRVMGVRYVYSHIFLLYIVVWLMAYSQWADFCFCKKIIPCLETCFSESGLWSLLL